MTEGPPLQLAASAAFDAVFGIFVVALVVLCVVTLTWAVRHDRPGREAWVRRQRARVTDAAGGFGPGSSTSPNGHGTVSPNGRGTDAGRGPGGRPLGRDPGGTGGRGSRNPKRPKRSA